MITFDLNEHSAAQSHSAHAQAEKLQNLHRVLYRQMRSYGLNLHPHWQQPVSFESLANPLERNVVALHYFRGRGEAQTVEYMMGRHMSDELTVERHPAIEIRLTPTHFAVELVISPSAWWDQQNLVGKLSVERHRTAFYHLLRTMDCAMTLGFWQGTARSDVSLSLCDIHNPRILGEWMSTFAEGQDWVRFGVWYDLNNPRLSESKLVEEVFQRVSALYKVYEFIAWSSDNDYRSVYQKLATRLG